MYEIYSVIYIFCDANRSINSRTFSNGDEEELPQILQSDESIDPS